MTTSGTFGYNVKRSIAFAYVPEELSKPGTVVNVELLGAHRPAIVHKDAPLLTESARARNAAKAKAM